MVSFPAPGLGASDPPDSPVCFLGLTPLSRIFLRRARSMICVVSLHRLAIQDAFQLSVAFIRWILQLVPGVSDESIGEGVVH